MELSRISTKPKKKSKKKTEVKMIVMNDMIQLMSTYNLDNKFSSSHQSSHKSKLMMKDSPLKTKRKHMTTMKKREKSLIFMVKREKVNYRYHLS